MCFLVASLSGKHVLNSSNKSSHAWKSALKKLEVSNNFYVHIIER